MKSVNYKLGTWLEIEIMDADCYWNLPYPNSFLNLKRNKM